MTRAGRSHPNDSHLPTVYLKPGEISICEQPTKVVTVLGSCVSVTMFNRRLGLGAICHGALPRSRKGEHCAGHCHDDFKYVNCSISYMIEQFRRYNILNNEIEVKLFGGADTLASRRENSIGRQNVKMALEMLGSEDMRVVAADVGDDFGRKVIFFSHTGEVFVKRVKKGTFEQKINE